MTDQTQQIDVDRQPKRPGTEQHLVTPGDEATAPNSPNPESRPAAERKSPAPASPSTPSSTQPHRPQRPNQSGLNDWQPVCVRHAHENAEIYMIEEYLPLDTQGVLYQIRTYSKQQGLLDATTLHLADVRMIPLFSREQETTDPVAVKIVGTDNNIRMQQKRYIEDEE